ncbi:hypothetical protein OUZ56_006743 [Daphnia magna]|uniref:Uncharacterized protein n=1 Tax=Daphnia magna TaxID=35525 RepID=A0ABQ9YWJ9_9CRUS|nr:hypothetical protein OUZ56_006743 [Daphnia magna]
MDAIETGKRCPAIHPAQAKQHTRGAQHRTDILFCFVLFFSIWGKDALGWRLVCRLLLYRMKSVSSECVKVSHNTTTGEWRVGESTFCLHQRGRTTGDPDRRREESNPIKIVCFFCFCFVNVFFLFCFVCFVCFFERERETERDREKRWTEKENVGKNVEAARVIFELLLLSMAGRDEDGRAVTIRQLFIFFFKSHVFIK